MLFADDIVLLIRQGLELTKLGLMGSHFRVEKFEAE